MTNIETKKETKKPLEMTEDNTIVVTKKPVRTPFKTLTFQDIKKISANCYAFEVAVTELGLEGEDAVSIKIPTSQISNVRVNKSLGCGKIDVPVWLIEAKTKELAK